MRSPAFFDGKPLPLPGITHLNMIHWLQKAAIGGGLFLLLGCEALYFTSPMPPQAEALEGFPKEVQGLYREVRSGDTLFIGPTFLRFGHWKSFFNLSYSNDIIIKKAAGYYIANIREDSTDPWLVLPARWDEADDSTLLVFYFRAPANKDNERTLSRHVTRLIYTGKHPKRVVIEPTEQWTVEATSKEFYRLLEQWFLDTAFVFRRLPEPKRRPSPPRK